MMGKPGVKRPPGRCKRRWEDTIKMGASRSEIRKHGLDLSGSG
jgi:hypothetical protein